MVKSTKPPSFPYVESQPEKQQLRDRPSRVKRIMQADEEVGKLAQSTPVAVGKALEGFLRDLIEAAAAEAKSRNTTKVTASHLCVFKGKDKSHQNNSKKAITGNPSFDFLKDSVAHLADPVDNAGSDEEKPKKVRKPRAPNGEKKAVQRKKKKVASEDEAEEAMEAEVQEETKPAANDDDDYDA